MPFKAIYANLACTDLEASTRWFVEFSGRDPDTRPMPGLCEWHLTESAGLQLHEDAQKAGAGTLTVMVLDIEAERERLLAAGQSVGAVEEADSVSIVRIQDPDGNLVVLAQGRDSR